MVAVPLLHVHPGVAHHEGKVRHAHGGLIHTAFSSDLPCEYAAHGHHDHASARTTSWDRADHGLNHQEIDFPVLTSTPKKPGGDQTTGVLSAGAQAASVDPAGAPSLSKPVPSPRSPILTAGLSVRGPPASTV